MHTGIIRNIRWEMGSSIYINPISGELTAIPHTLGKFVIGVCVQEIRGGVVLSSSIRDFQVNVEPCNIPSSVPIVVTDNSASTAIKVNDTTYSNCQGVTVRFDNGVNQTGNTYFWDFGDPKKQMILRRSKPNVRICRYRRIFCYLNH